MSIRTRFAPSPTGFLHIGGVRTALYNWLYARRLGGEFFLRIEDTDLERSEDRFTDDILDSMRWLGLTSDSDLMFQSHRMELYRGKAEVLIAQGLAYRCTATEAEIEGMRVLALAEGRKPMYDRRYREANLPAPMDGTPYVIRAKIPLEGAIRFKDLVRGEITVANAEIDDFVLIRSNGAPTYNFSCVIDDAETRITHVIRGDDHINNTPKQLHLYRFLGSAVPEFAHLPMILGADKKKLSKRHGAVSANQYRADGYLPETVLNFLARIGWSHGDQEVFSIPELIAAFDFDSVQRASGVFNPEKLAWLSGEHLRRADPSRIAGILVADFTASLGGPGAAARLQSGMGMSLLALLQPKARTLAEIAAGMAPLLHTEPLAVDSGALKWAKDPALKENTKGVISRFLNWGKAKADGRERLADTGLGHAELDAYFRAEAERAAVKLGDLVQPLRLFLSGQLAGASVFDLLATLPWAAVERRLALALEA